MSITTYYMTKNPCYTKAEKMAPKGIVVHDTAAGNPCICRYVGPDDGIIGPNKYGNHWNKATANKMVHAFIGKTAAGEIATYNVLPWNYKCWGCGSGPKGSYNNTHVQFEICDDGYNDAGYFKKVYQEAVELCAKLCKDFNLDVSTIVSHAEAHAKGYASDHNDTRPWFSKFGKTMDNFREDVREAIKESTAPVADLKPGKKKVKVPKNDVLNVRTDPIYTANKIGELKNGETVEVLGVSSNGWVNVKFTSKGWVNGSYLE